MLYNFILLFLAILPIILLGCYVYFKDKDKEPKRLMIKLFIGGILAAILTIVISIAIENIFPFFKRDYSLYNDIELFIYTFIIVGFIEEISKWILLYLFSYHNKEFDQLYDMIVYSVFVALGFAFIENLLYVYDGGFTIALIRFCLAIPGHVSMSVFMGYFLSFAKLAEVNHKKKLKMKYILFSILVPSLFHGIYDYCLLSNNLILLFIFLVFIIILFYQANKKLMMMSKLETKLIQ